MVGKVASVINHNPISRYILSKQFLRIVLIGLVVGPALVFAVPDLGGLNGPAGFLVWWPITLLVLRFYCYYRALKIKSKHYQCNVCRYQWVISEERPALERIRLKQAEIELIIARRSANQGQMIVLLNTLTALVIVEQDDWQLGTTYAREALSLAEGRSNQQEVAYSLNNLGFGLTFQGEQGQAIPHLKRSLALFRELSDWSGCSQVLNSLGLALLQAGLYEEARLNFEESLTFKRKMDDFGRGFVADIEGLAGVALGQAAPLRAARLGGAAKALHERSGLIAPLTLHLRFQQTVELIRTRLDPASFENEWQIGLKMTLSQLLDYALDPSEVVG